MEKAEKAMDKDEDEDEDDNALVICTITEESKPIQEKAIIVPCTADINLPTPHTALLPPTQEMGMM